MNVLKHALKSSFTQSNVDDVLEKFKSYNKAIDYAGRSVVGVAIGSFFSLLSLPGCPSNKSRISCIA